MKRKHSGWQCRLSALLLLVPLAAAHADIRIATPAITSLLNEQETGLYQRIMRRALSDMDTPVRQSFFPFKRALSVFEYRQADCIYSLTDVIERDLGSDAVISSFPLGAFSYYMFNRQPDAPLVSPEELADRAVSGVIGHESYYRHAVEKAGSFVLVNSDRQNLKLLREGRVDVIIAALPDIAPFVPTLNYSPQNPLFTGYDRITCHRTAETTQFIRQLSAELRHLKASGFYRQAAGNLYVEFDALAAECPETGPCSSRPLTRLVPEDPQYQAARQTQQDSAEQPLEPDRVLLQSGQPAWAGE